MRLNRGTVALLVISLCVVIAVGIFQQPIIALMTSPTPTSTVNQLLPFGLANEATRFVVRQGENFTQMERIDGVWQVTDGTMIDDSRETNNDFVVGLLRLIGTIEYSRVFEGDDLSQYGLETSTASIEITSLDATYNLQLGATNPDGDELYVQVNDNNQVYLVPAVFEFSNIMRLATEPPYQDEVTEDALSDDLLFPDVFGYQIAEFTIQDMRDGSSITYTQGEQGTWMLDGTVVNPDIEVDHVQAAVNVSQFLFLDIEPLAQSVRDSLTDIAILTLSMTTTDNRSYTMTVYTLEDVGYAGILYDGTEREVYALPTDRVNLFFDMVTDPPYMTSS